MYSLSLTCFFSNLPRYKIYHLDLPPPPRMQSWHSWRFSSGFLDKNIYNIYSQPHWASQDLHEPRKKKPPTFHYIGWLIGILILVYCNPYLTGRYNPLYQTTNQGFFHCSYSFHLKIGWEELLGTPPKVCVHCAFRQSQRCRPWIGAVWKKTKQCGRGIFPGSLKDVGPVGPHKPPISWDPSSDFYGNGMGSSMGMGVPLLQVPGNFVEKGFATVMVMVNGT